MLRRLFHRNRPAPAPDHSPGNDALGNGPRWERFPPHPGFALVDENGAYVAYMHVRPDADTLAGWKRRYPAHAHLIDEAIDACFPLEADMEEQP